VKNDKDEEGMDSRYHHSDTGVVSNLDKFANLAAASTILASILILLGWSFDIALLKSLIPGAETTKPLGAVGGLFDGLALYLFQQGKNKEKSWQYFVGLACAGLVFFISSLILLEYGLGVDFGIDRLLFREAVLAEPGPFPGRPIFAASACLTVLSLALMVTHRKVEWIDFIIFIVLFVGMVVLASYIYNVSNLSRLGPYRAVPLPSALLLMILTIGFLCARPDSVLLAPIVISSPLGESTRRLLLVAVLVPFTLGWFRLMGQRLGFYDTELGVALVAATNATIFACFVYWYAGRLNRVDLQRKAEITERKRAEDEIRLLNASLEQRVAERTQQFEYERVRWQGIVEGMVEEIWSCNVQGKMSLLNLGSITAMGLDMFADKSVEEIYQEVDILYPDGRQRPPEQSPLLRSLQGEVVRGEEIMRHRRTGVKRYRQYSSAPTRDETGAITGAVAVVRDITEQKQAEEGMRRYELLSEHSKDIVLFIRRKDGRILEANTAAVKAYGYNRDELLELSIHDLRAPDTHGLTAEQMAQADAGGILFETVHLRKDGSTFPVEVSSQGATIGLERTLISIVRDITERKQNEEQLRYQAVLLSNVGDAVIASDNQFRITAWNAAAESLYGWKAGEVIGRNGLEVLRTEWPEKDADEMRQAIAEKGRWRGEATQVRRDGIRFPVEVSSIVMRDGEGQITGYVSANRDITERKRMEEKVRESQELFLAT
jgi:PAS domain S-box-containing protein